MKIAIACLGETPDAKVCEVAGRAPYYLFFEDGKLVKVQKNPFLYGPGAGFAVAKMLADEGVEVVVAGRYGPNMLGTLAEKNIKALIARNISAEQAVKAAREGKLAKAA